MPSYKKEFRRQPEQYLQAAFDYVKANPGVSREDISQALGLARAATAATVEILVERRFLCATYSKRCFVYTVHPQAVEIESVSDLNAPFAGRRFVDPWVANHPLVGKIPCSVSEQGIDAMRQWLAEADRARHGGVAA
jgi:hypothetical protein